MRSAATLLVLVLASCASPTDPDTTATGQAATTLPQVNTSCQWIAGKTCYGQPNDASNIWPTGIGITSVQVLTRSGPTRLDGRQQTFLAFVVWNDQVVGRIFRLDVGSSDAVNWNNLSANTFAARTFGLPDTRAGAAGATSGSPSPPPHPNVEGPITFESTYLDAVTTSAASVDAATKAFLATASSAID